MAVKFKHIEIFSKAGNMRIIFINVFSFILFGMKKKNGWLYSCFQAWILRDVVLFSWKKCNLFAYIFFLQSNISSISQIYLQRHDCCCCCCVCFCCCCCRCQFFQILSFFILTMLLCIMCECNSGCVALLQH